jgi:hypothetical protein
MAQGMKLPSGVMGQLQNLQLLLLVAPLLLLAWLQE